MNLIRINDRLSIFTVEHNEGTVDFLNVSLRIVEGLIRFDKKLTNSEHYLNYKSNHSIEHTKEVISIKFYSLRIRIIRKILSIR